MRLIEYYEEYIKQRCIKLENKILILVTNCNRTIYIYYCYFCIYYCCCCCCCCCWTFRNCLCSEYIQNIIFCPWEVINIGPPVQAKSCDPELPEEDEKYFAELPK